MPILFVAGFALLLVAWLLWQPRRAARRRERVRAQPFPEAWREIIRRRVPYVRHLPAHLQMQLKKHIQVFVAEKTFIGCGGLRISDEIRVTIAAQACLLILNRDTDYFPKLRQILVYPSAFLVDRQHTDDAGVLRAHRQVLSGESWSQGQVILAWDDTLEGAAIVDDARNLVIHEFAHQLDSEKGYPNGAPDLGSRQRYERWSGVMSRAYERLRHLSERGEQTWLDPYGATSPEEFFAVVSEAFFEQAAEMARRHPDLYRELRDFYCIDPLSW